MVKGWRAAATLTFAAVSISGVSGCGGQADASTKKPTQTVQQAWGIFEADLDELETVGCPPDCGPELDEVAENARALRKAMTADTARASMVELEGASFWSEAYGYLDSIEDGHAWGEAKVYHPMVFGPARELKRWMAAHPLNA
ncbi:hypothetical protein [Streptomyces sp. NPDC051561]|uniref:hypothetical protein n=1 Tax=Streptomyces sp. NPDC051561 TaxID=3365658 RepID=UPI00378DA08C